MPLFLKVNPPKNKGLFQSKQGGHLGSRYVLYALPPSNKTSPEPPAENFGQKTQRRSKAINLCHVMQGHRAAPDKG